MKKYLILIFVALAAVFQSCDNNDDLWDAIDDLKSRVQALETQVDALNGNIEALQKLYGGATISKVETSDGKYLITLTNGETIELVQGSEAVAVIPIVSINDKGEWQVSTDNGATFTSLGVKAVAEDGTTPRFRIDEAASELERAGQGRESIEREAQTIGNTGKKGGGEAAEDAGSDPKLRDALEIATESGKISTSLLQRRLSIGYGRAAKIIDIMEARGFVSAPDGQKPREVLISKTQYREMVVNNDERLN